MTKKAIVIGAEPAGLTAEKDTKVSYQNKSRNISLNADDPIPQPKDQGKQDQRMLVIQRLTRIYFLRKFFAYPIQLGFDTLRTLGLIRTIRIPVSFRTIYNFYRIRCKLLALSGSIQQNTLYINLTACNLPIYDKVNSKLHPSGICPKIGQSR
jgi:hypothetical protein